MDMKLKLTENTLNAYLQEALIRELYTQAELDAMNPAQVFKTKLQVEQFQVWYNKVFRGNLVIDGIPGPKTKAALEHYFEASEHFK